MNPQAREAEPASLIVPDIASARPDRSFRYSPRRLSLGKRILRIASVGMFAAAVHNPMITPPVSAQEGPNQKDEQMVDPNQFTDPAVAGIVAEAEADIPAEDPLETRSCSPWPEEMVEMRRNLLTLEGVCYARYTDRSQIPYPDIYELLQRDGWGNADWERRMIHVLASDEVYKQRGIHLIGHEFFHLHQVRIVQDNNLQPPWQESYFNIAEGREFVNSLNAVITNARSSEIDITVNFLQWGKWLGDEFVVGGNYYENAAQLASIWYNYPGWITGDAWAPMRDFATRWWPKN